MLFFECFIIKYLVFICLILQNTKTVNGKKKLWRSLKQITAQERNLPWPDSAVNCKLNKLIFICSSTLFYLYEFCLDSCISAPPSFKPAKKYSDISGLIVRILLNHNLTCTLIYFV